jgi:hypothetical protein
MKYWAVIAMLMASTYHVGVSACSFVFAADVEFSQGSSALKADEVRRLADFFIQVRQNFSGGGAVVLTAMAKPDEMRPRDLAEARLKSVRMYLARTHYTGEVHEDVFLYRGQPPEGETGRTVGLQFVPSRPIDCPQPRNSSVSFFIFSSHKEG